MIAICIGLNLEPFNLAQYNIGLASTKCFAYLQHFMI